MSGEVWMKTLRLIADSQYLLYSSLIHIEAGSGIHLDLLDIQVAFIQHSQLTAVTSLAMKKV